jgi:hypothetical protein
VRYHEITGALASRRPFAFSRYGDGEVLCMAGAKGENRDGHSYHATLGAALRCTVQDPKPQITYALQGLVRRDKKLKAVLAKHSKVETWADADVLHRQSRKNVMGDLFARMEERTTILVGPDRLQKLGFCQIVIPDRNCWEAYGDVIQQIIKFYRAGDVLVLCAGMMASVIIQKLVDKLEDATFLDAGSLFDPYVGHSTRAYHREVLRNLKKGGTG